MAPSFGAGQELTKLPLETIDTFICVHRRDVDYLLELVLRSYEVNFVPKGTLTLITNDVAYLQRFLERTRVAPNAVLTTDSDWLTAQEMELPGWYRQQVIKLRAHEFCTTENFNNLGADTVLLQPIDHTDLIHDGMPILYYTHHRLPDTHLLYERQRVRYVARILRVKPAVASRYVDFINDVFCFNREILIKLNADLEALHGHGYFHNLLRNLDLQGDQKKFGEWTLYSVFVLDKLKQPLTMRNTRNGFLYQAHSQRNLNRYRFDTKAVHFVGKGFDVNYIKRRIGESGSALSQSIEHQERLGRTSRPE
jgi:hypothetical protein